MRKLFWLIILMACASVAYAAPFTVGKIPKAKTGTYLMDSSIYETATGIGIGTLATQGKLDVDGSVYVGSGTPEYIDTDNSIYVAGQIEADGGIYGTFFGDGSRLSGISTSSVDLSSVDQGIYPDTDNVYDIGSSALSWQDLYVDGAVYTPSLVTTGTDESLTGNTYPTNKIDFNANANAVNVNALDVDGAVYVDGSLYLTSATTNTVGLWISQSDAGCSFCTVDVNGINFACTDKTCPAGM